MFIRLTRKGDHKQVRVNMNKIAEYTNVLTSEKVHALLVYECGGVELAVIETAEQIDKLIIRANTVITY